MNSFAGQRMIVMSVSTPCPDQLDREIGIVLGIVDRAPEQSLRDETAGDREDRDRKSCGIDITDLTA